MRRHKMMKKLTFEFPTIRRTRPRSHKTFEVVLKESRAREYVVDIDFIPSCRVGVTFWPNVSLDHIWPNDRKDAQYREGKHSRGHPES